MVVHLLSPDKRYSELYIANYMNLRIREQLLRLEGVGNVTVFGGSEYAMRIWLDPARLSSYGLAASDVVAALQAQNIQVSGGTLGSQPAPVDTPLQRSEGHTYELQSLMRNSSAVFCLKKKTK